MWLRLRRRARACVCGGGEGVRVLMLEGSDPELHCSQQEFRHSLPVLSCRLVCCPPASTVMLIGA